ncbi:Endoplasmic reticulum zinc transporter [Epicoccum nigrum]|nr:Endoplasmic reticulum zinc transporter [Epicoccum nigrum]
MASNGIPLPPRTPTPPPDDDAPYNPVGLGFEDQLSAARLGFDQDALSPMSATFPSKQYATLGPSDSVSQRATPTMLYTPASATFPYTPASIMSGTDVDAPSMSGTESTRNPFNFQSVTYQPGRPKQNDVGRRRGHKYKHSSVSHQIFLEPAPRAPLQLPASLPIPTFKEYRTSMSKDQKLRLAWCFGHLLVAGLVQWGSHESLALTVLSRLIFYDAIGAFLCVAVDVGSNFEVWKRSSIRHPFGFERLEVIAGLGMSVGLLFMGLDLISHGLTHALENSGGHTAHHADAHERVSPGSIDLSALSGIVSTLTSAILLKNHARIGVSDVMYDIETDAAVSAVEEAKFWQVHYGLCQANLKVRVRNLDEMGRLRDRIGSMVRNRLGGSYGSGGGQKWEVSTQVTLEKD